MTRVNINGIIYTQTKTVNGEMLMGIYYPKLSEGEKIVKLIKEDVSRNNATLIRARGLDGSENLAVVMACNEDKKEYITWITNIESGGLFSGHYFPYGIDDKYTAETEYEKALSDYTIRK